MFEMRMSCELEIKTGSVALSDFKVVKEKDCVIT